ncbi:threonine-tRNA ligase [Spizellomyces punctatus DAOM BR117]|uniref:Threonine--tRNA ligase, cytoplasmic n=1 Tax=Spizellomyces punctatus (strain DAOM BR117) TaxID=645134 RepID=A0A0L0HJ39_SPIPD|nr:threonine-tRNA ligase [Spizellomyces punctatus DAOM BR117]KND00849.1 threonine-tRNA ligase [Spizellomyces punctatus DAOM BR117]|eukprot:XP_016608888.1 threonine-tRNA ligase [Spizellomyces punctatus DAOM BR117]
MASNGVGEVSQKMKDLAVKAANPKKQKGGDAASLEITPPPEYIQWRIDMFERLKKEYDEKVSKMPRENIKITLPDGKEISGTSWETSPLDIAKSISKSLSEKVVIAKVDGQLWDLPRPLEQSCQLQLLTFDDDEGQKVYWHSSAHVLGEACELHYGCHLCLGPPIEQGFYYEMGMDGAVNAADYPALETLAKKAINEKQPFERLVVEKETLLEMFKHNKYKQHFIKDKVPDGTSTTVYRCGPLIDLCVGPHIPHTGRIKAFAVTKNSASYFLADAKNDSLQRVYGISFPDNKQMKEYKEFMEEAAKRDHRKIGQEQELFFFDDLSPGSCFFLPAGAKIYNKLMELQKGEYRRRGFQEVITPNMYNTKLWETSGHWANYSEDMFVLDVEKEKWALKPMNCPGHCVMFKHRERSYRELPLRLADFGVLHRNEASGALSGLTRVRRFQQDDAHIFCTISQLGDEIDGCLEFLQHIYGIFNFEFYLKLSTRPEKYLGDVETWDKAEKILEEALVKFGKKWELNPGDGAFYGPKIDIVMTDALRRKHQCATLQLDFQLPQRFELQYRSKDMTYERPVMIHRAILGSVERFIAILTENFAGKWPFWLSPKQVMVIPVAPKYNDYAAEVAQLLHVKGLNAEADLSEFTLKKKIVRADLMARYNFIFVVGEEEQAARTVNCRNRDDRELGGKGQVVPLDEVIPKLLALEESKSLNQII